MQHSRNAGLTSLRRRLALLTCCAATVSTLVLVEAPGVASQSATATEAVAPMNTYWGTTHAHTGAFNSHGADRSTVEQVFGAARANGFDFLVLTEHSGPSGPAEPEQFYADARRVAAEMTTAEFAAIAGYEYTDNLNDGDADPRGHLTVVGTDDFVDASAPGMDFSSFLSYLVEQARDGRTVLAGFNHPPSAGHPASRPSLLTAETRRLLSLTETHSRTSYVRAQEEQHYSAMIAELDAGWRVAPTCGLDSHGVQRLVAVESADVKPCRTGVLAAALTPAHVVEALLARRIFASRDMNLAVRYRANERWMGAQLNAPGRVDFTIRAQDPDVGRLGDRIRRVDVIGTRGVVLASRRFDAHRVVWRPQVRTGKNTYLLVRVFTREHPTATALAAPVWLTAS